MLLRLSLLLVLLSSLPAHAHKVHVFAWVSGDTVTVESGLSGNKPLVKSKVTVKEMQTSQIILQGTGDKDGIFTFIIPQEIKRKAPDLLITVSGGEGHQSEWLLPATEYVSERSIPTVLPQKHMASSTELEIMLQELLEKELAPIRRSLTKAEDKKPGFRDIIGGIGYLIGLAGLVAWLKNKKPAKKQKK